MRIGIIGSGISVLVCAYLLHKDHDIVLFEANNYIGGHTHTIDIKRNQKNYAVDTGFIVFNEKNYPHLIKLFNSLGVESQPTSMNFSVKCEKTGLEYSTHTIKSLFAQKKNLFSYSFLRMIFEIFRFRKEFNTLLIKGKSDITLA